MLSKLSNLTKFHKIDRLCTTQLSPFCSKIVREYLVETKEDTKTDDSSKWSAKNRYKIGLYTMGIMGLIGFSYSFYAYGSPVKNEDGSYIEDEYSKMPIYTGYSLRFVKNLKDFNKTVQDPISEKLLPDPHPQYHPMTLVIESTDILLHPQWTYKGGWKYKKRPGLELFLEAVSPFFEVVIFTSDTAMNLHPILQQLDPNFQKIHYRLYREATRYRHGVHIKDLTNLNRDLNKVIRVDWNEKACSLQPENSFIIKRWKGDMEDRELIDLASFLRMIATNNLSDVREGLSPYASFDDPLMEFRRRCEHLKTRMQQMENGGGAVRSKSTFNNVLKNLRRN